MGYYTTFWSIKRLRKCEACHKRKSKVLVNQIDNGKIETVPLCVSCFKKWAPDYTLGYKCSNCEKCFNCELQKVLFTSKEIKQFKKAQEIKLLS